VSEQKVPEPEDLESEGPNPVAAPRAAWDVGYRAGRGRCTADRRTRTDHE
jgi:hypothetical protein